MKFNILKKGLEAFESIKHKINLVVLTADRWNSIIVLIESCRKMFSLVNSDLFLQPYNDVFVSFWKHLIKEGDTIKRFSLSSFLPFRLYGLHKILKPDIPLRSIFQFLYGICRRDCHLHFQIIMFTLLNCFSDDSPSVFTWNLPTLTLPLKKLAS